MADQKGEVAEVEDEKVCSGDTSEDLEDGNIEEEIFVIIFKQKACIYDVISTIKVKS